MKQTITLTCDEVFKAAHEYVARRGWKVLGKKMLFLKGEADVRCCNTGTFCLHIVVDVEPEQADGSPYRGDQPTKPLDTKPEPR